MASYQQMYYCKNCKKNVSVDNNNKCLACHGTQIKKSWSVRFRVVDLNGEKHKRLTGFETKKEAEKAYIDFMANYTPLQNSKSISLKFDDILNEYFKNCSLDNTESTLYDKQHIFDLFITPYFHNKDINTISKIDLQNWQNKLWTTKNEKGNKNYSWKYLTKIRGYLYNYLEYCKRIYDIPNLLENIKVPKNKDIKKNIIFWELEEFNKFISKIDDIFWKTLWLTFMYTGARFNEIRALNDKDVQNNIIHITKALPGKKVKENKHIPKATKNYKTITKEMPDILTNQFKDYFKWKNENNISNKFLFGGDFPISEGTLRRKLEDDIKNAEVKYISPHGFRHSYVSLLIHLGVSTKIIAELIGDREIQVIETYGHLYSDAKSNAISLLNEKINANLKSLA